MPKDNTWLDEARLTIDSLWHTPDALVAKLHALVDDCERRPPFTQAMAEQFAERCAGFDAAFQPALNVYLSCHSAVLTDAWVSLEHNHGAITGRILFRLHDARVLGLEAVDAGEGAVFSSRPVFAGATHGLNIDVFNDVALPELEQQWLASISGASSIDDHEILAQAIVARLEPLIEQAVAAPDTIEALSAVTLTGTGTAVSLAPDADIAATAWRPPPSHRDTPNADAAFARKLATLDAQWAEPRRQSRRERHEQSLSRFRATLNPTALDAIARWSLDSDVAYNAAQGADLERQPDPAGPVRLEHAFEDFPLLVDLAATNPTLLAPLVAGHTPAAVIREATPDFQTLVGINADQPAEPLRQVSAGRSDVPRSQPLSLLSGCALIEPTTTIETEAELARIARLGRLARAFEATAFYTLVAPALIDGLTRHTIACPDQDSTRLLNHADLRRISDTLCRLDEIVTVWVMADECRATQAAPISRRIGQAGIKRISQAAHAFAMNDDTRARALAAEALETDRTSIDVLADRLRMPAVARVTAHPDASAVAS